MKKTPFTLDQHKDAGKKFQQINTLLSDLMVSVSWSYSIKIADRLGVIQRRIGQIRSELEAQMFTEHSELSNTEGFKVYYSYHKHPFYLEKVPDKTKDE